MLTGSSNPLWQLLDPILRRLQYRSRLMGLQAVVVAILIGICFTLLPRNWERRLGVALAVLVVGSAISSLYVELQHRYASFDGEVSLSQVRQAEIATGGLAFTSFGEFTPRWRTLPFGQEVLDQLGPDFDAQSRPIADPSAGIVVDSARVASNAWDLSIRAAQAETLTLNLLYYPRWKALLDGIAAPLSPQPETGYTQIAVPGGPHQIVLRYGTTSVEALGWTISLLTLLVLVVLAFLRRSGGQSNPRPVLTTSSGVNDAGVLPAHVEAMAPPWWLLISLTALFVFKVAYVDTSTTWLRCVSTPDRVCGAQASTDVPFAGGPRLRGYTVPQSSFRPGDAVRVNLYWQGEPAMAGQLVSFVHIRNSEPGLPLNPRTDNEIWAQDEHETLSGFSTAEYLPGRLYLDEFRIPLPVDMPPGRYFLEVGWYDPATGEQLEPVEEAVTPPLDVLWRSILLPSIEVDQPSVSAAAGQAAP
jgi:hypothetical protein